MPLISGLMDGAVERARQLGRPLVTLSYAQSLDGCLTARRGQGLAISGPETKLLTHRLRAANSAILVGIGTILADNPRLTARLAGGPHPRPVVLDRQLRTPLESAILQCETCQPLLFCAPDADPRCRARLELAGGQVVITPLGMDGLLDLRAVLAELYRLGLPSLMVEGGGSVLGSFLKNGLGDQAMITIAPFWAGSDAHVAPLLSRDGQYPALEHPNFQTFGRDMVVWGKIGEDFYESSDSVFHSSPTG